jgi:hypothetical protein
MDKELGRTSSHRIIFHLGIAEIIELATQYSMAVFTAFGTTFHPLINKVGAKRELNIK